MGDYLEKWFRWFRSFREGGGYVPQTLLGASKCEDGKQNWARNRGMSTELSRNQRNDLSSVPLAMCGISTLKRENQ